jgi:ABC-type uncharacterized transport system, permease component
MSYEKLLLFGVVLLYSLATLGIFIGILASRRIVKDVANGLTLAGFALHTVLVGYILSIHSIEEISAGYYLFLLPWFLLLLYLGAWWLLRLPFLTLTVAPFSLLLSIFSMRLTRIQIELPEHLTGVFIGLHMTSLFLSIGLIVLAFGAGCLFLYVEKKLKKKAPIGKFSKELPSLATFDKINHTAVLIGFPLYTLGLITGFVWAPLFLQAVVSPKILIALFLWCLYALLFYQRLALGLRGKKAAIMAVVLFLIALLSMAVDQVMSHHSLLVMPAL